MFAPARTTRTAAPATWMRSRSPSTATTAARVSRIRITARATVSAEQGPMPGTNRAAGDSPAARSVFLLWFKKDMDTINFDLCDKNFENFINLQKNVVDKIKIIGDTTRNFGIRNFLNNNN